MNNNIGKNGLILLLAGFYLGIMLVAASPSQAKWWVFGKKDDTPEFSSLKFNTVNVENVDQEIALSKEDLVNGMITVRGRTEVGDGEVGKVEISLDGGEKWQKATLGDRGLFTFEIKPEIDRQYDFRIKALSTTGKMNDIEDHSFTFMVGARPSSDEVKKVFLEMLRLYMAEDRIGFMALVHPDFEGDRAALEDAISDDFSYFDNIRIEPNITRVVSFDGNYEVYFTFNRQLQSANSGQLLKDNAASSMTFARGSGFKLFEMAAPLIFGLSNVRDLATSVTEESVGQQVIMVDENGNAGTGTLSEDIRDSGDTADAEHVTLQNFEGYFIATGMIANDFNADIFFEHNIFFIGNGSSWVQMPNGSFASATSAPNETYMPFNGPDLENGTTFAVKLSDGSYAIVGVDQLNAPDSVVISIKYPVPGP